MSKMAGKKMRESKNLEKIMRSEECAVGQCPLCPGSLIRGLGLFKALRSSCYSYHPTLNFKTNHVGLENIPRLQPAVELLDTLQWLRVWGEACRESNYENSLSRCIVLKSENPELSRLRDPKPPHECTVFNSVTCSSNRLTFSNLFLFFSVKKNLQSTWNFSPRKESRNSVFLECYQKQGRFSRI